MSIPELHIRLPDWVSAFLEDWPEVLAEPASRMEFAIALSRENIRQGTGGPFGAGVFDGEGRLIAPGVNLVTSANCSLLHAEMVALALAQQRLGRYDLSNGGGESLELVTSTEPCAMCLGAIPWSGVARVRCGARDADARARGFDEGPKPAHWRAELRQRGIEVKTDLLRDAAAAVLDAYVRDGGELYNSGGR